MFLNTNQFLLKLQLSCASRTTCISILIQTSSQGLQFSTAIWTGDDGCRVYLICSAMRALVFCAHVLRERGVSTGIWLLGFWYPTKLERENKAGCIPSLLHHTCKDTEKAFQTSGSIVTTVHPAWILICYLEIGYGMDAGSTISLLLHSVFNTSLQRKTKYLLHFALPSWRDGAPNSCSFILLRGGVFCLFF